MHEGGREGDWTRQQHHVQRKTRITTAKTTKTASKSPLPLHKTSKPPRARKRTMQHIYPRLPPAPHPHPPSPPSQTQTHPRIPKSVQVVKPGAGTLGDRRRRRRVPAARVVPGTPRGHGRGGRGGAGASAARLAAVRGRRPCRCVCHEAIVFCRVHHDFAPMDQIVRRGCVVQRFVAVRARAGARSGSRQVSGS